jgi:hypothetical protein
MCLSDHTLSPLMRQVRGYDFDKGVDYDGLFASLKTTGFQATNFGLAVDEINRMVPSPPPPSPSSTTPFGAPVRPHRRRSTGASPTRRSTKRTKTTRGMRASGSPCGAAFSFRTRPT